MFIIFQFQHVPSVLFLLYHIFIISFLMLSGLNRVREILLAKRTVQ